MSIFLMIETSTEACSVALSIDNKIVSTRYICEQKAHARILAPFIEEVLKENSLTAKDLSAVAVSEGPGSYTGLRVGVSTAKGICYGASIPLISIGTLQILANMGKSYLDNSKERDNREITIIPMIDARRMEVYCARFNRDARMLTEVEPLVLEIDTFSGEFTSGNILFCGDGAEKYIPVLDQKYLGKSILFPCHPIAEAMLPNVIEKWEAKTFEDSAYFEPFYLKEFIAGKSSKKLL